MGSPASTLRVSIGEHSSEPPPRCHYACYAGTLCSFVMLGGTAGQHPNIEHIERCAARPAVNQLRGAFSRVLHSSARPAALREKR